MVIDPSDIFYKTPRFTILKNGDVIPATTPVEIVQAKCSSCGALQTEHSRLHNGLCYKCEAKKIELPPPVLPKRDDVHFNMSSAFSWAQFEQNEGRDDGFLILYTTNGRTMVYVNVPRENWLGICSAKSAGKYYNQHIKGKFLQQLDEEGRRSSANKEEKDSVSV